MMAISKVFGLGAVSTILLACAVSAAENEVPFPNCIVQPSGPSSLSRIPAVIPNLDPQVSIPLEGYVKLHFESSDTDSMWPSPTGDFTFTAGPYDPASQRLYLWGYFSNGWIEVRQAAGGLWLFDQSDTIEPLLYYPAHDIEDVSLIERSETLGLQFYSGFTSPHWLTGSQSYRFYQIAGTKMSRVAALESRNLIYLGDDPSSGLAALAPFGSRWSQNTELLVWYDGVRIVERAPRKEIPHSWCP